MGGVGGQMRTNDKTRRARERDGAKQGGFDAVELRRTDFKRCFDNGMNNAQVLERSMYAHRFLANLCLANGDLVAAESQIDLTMKYLEPQLQLAPYNPDCHTAAAKTHLLPANLQITKGKHDAAQTN